MDFTLILVIGAGLFLAYKLLFAKKVDAAIANAGGVDKLVRERLDLIDKANPELKGNTTVDLVTKWQAARKTAAEANCPDAVKAFDDAFKLLNAEGTEKGTK